jgi:hypothetical protein
MAEKVSPKQRMVAGFLYNEGDPVKIAPETSCAVPVSHPLTSLKKFSGTVFIHRQANQ